MSTVFIHPRLDSAVSGGNVYNRHIIQQAQENNYPLRSFPVDPTRTIDRLDQELARSDVRLVIWDSLFLEYLSELHCMQWEIDQVLLVHYLPSLNPACDVSLQKKLKRRELAAIRKCSKVICTGPTTFRALDGRVPRESLFVCEPGVDDCFKPPADAQTKGRKKKAVELISVANLLPEKGHLDVLNVLSELRTHRWRWHIVGSADADRGFSQTLHASVLAADLGPRICWHGTLNRRRLARLLTKMDLFVSASHYESYGMAIAEAVATGLPIIATRTGAAPDLIDHAQSGFLVQVGDRNSMRSALEKLIVNPDLRRAFCLKARSRPRWSWKSCFENFEKACRSIS